MKIFLTKEQIQKKVLEIADYINKKNIKPICIPVLKGAFNFGADLFKNLNNAELDFIMVSSYIGTKKNPHNKFNVVLDTRENLNNRDILIIEDIIDSGESMINIVKLLKSKKPKTITVISLIKRKTAKIEFECTEFIYGFEADLGWLIGYGLDENNVGRNLEHIKIK